MARRSAAQRAAFRKMIAARKRSLRTNGKSRRRRRPKAVVVLTNPRRRRHKRHNASSPRRRRRNAAILANPSLRRRRRRRNPDDGGGVMGFVKDYFKAGIPAVLAGGAFGLVDSKMLSGQSALVRIGAKVGTATLMGLVFRKNPVLAAATMGGVLGTIGYEQAISLSGGTTAPTSTASVKGIAALIREDPKAMGVLLQEMRGMGLSVDSTVSLGRMGYQPDQNYANVNLG